jgi:hypothetical protein
MNELGLASHRRRYYSLKDCSLLLPILSLCIGGKMGELGNGSNF